MQAAGRRNGAATHDAGDRTGVGFSGHAHYKEKGIFQRFVDPNSLRAADAARAVVAAPVDRCA